jgi:hypothetical protein
MTDIYTTPTYAQGKFANGALSYKFLSIISLKTTNVVGDILRFGRSLTSANIITSIKVSNTALTGLTSVDVGIYRNGLGEDVVDKDLFASAVSFATARTRAGAVEVLGTVVEKSIYNIQDLSNSIEGNPKITGCEAVDLALTLNAAPTANGIILVEVEYI